MPPPPAPTAAISGIDAYLQVQTQRAGAIKGEATAQGHVDDIQLLGWQWGLTANSALGGTAATARRSYSALTVVKHVDAATTPLLSALATNDKVKQAKLTLRRAGGDQEDFFSITLSDARIATLTHSAEADGNTRETLSFAFTKVEVSYTRQQTSGRRGATSTFNDELPSN